MTERKNRNNEVETPKGRNLPRQRSLHTGDVFVGNISQQRTVTAQGFEFAAIVKEKYVPDYTRLRAGDPDVWARWVEEKNTELIRTIRKKLDQKDLAEELVQDGVAPGELAIFEARLAAMKKK